MKDRSHADGVLPLSLDRHGNTLHGSAIISLAWMSLPFRSQWSWRQSLALQWMSLPRSGFGAFQILNLLVILWAWSTWRCRPAVMGSFSQMILQLLLMYMASSWEEMVPEGSTLATTDFEEEASD